MVNIGWRAWGIEGFERMARSWQNITGKTCLLGSWLPLQKSIK
jgi:hypothetical protein